MQKLLKGCIPLLWSTDRLPFKMMNCVSRNTYQELSGTICPLSRNQCHLVHWFFLLEQNTFCVSLHVNWQNTSVALPVISITAWRQSHTQQLWHQLTISYSILLFFCNIASHMLQLHRKCLYCSKLQRSFPICYSEVYARKYNDSSTNTHLDETVSGISVLNFKRPPVTKCDSDYKTNHSFFNLFLQ